MQLPATLIAAFTGLALAAPSFPTEALEAPTPYTNNATAAAAEPAHLAERAVPITATYCEHSQHTGPCATFAFSQGTCYGMPPYWNDKISSLFIEGRLDYCVAYADGGCGGQQVVVSWAGINKIADKGMNDKISSIKCIRSSKNGP
ncbi:hypothetical protein SLS56_000220 [Neofusicoccum ribis]|uniref:Beta gamma crystallin protein n=1 Tax=Neofusicoccum ribis TaxID=45134 RepID=A0ABR3TG60_9PEZI